jgi:hypothetical protein
MHNTWGHEVDIVVNIVSEIHLEDLQKVQDGHPFPQ